MGRLSVYLLQCMKAREFKKHLPAVESVFNPEVIPSGRFDSQLAPEGGV
jgi:hypothetical protein